MQSQNKALGDRAPTTALLLRFALPSIAAMFVTALYSLVDALYVSQIDTAAGAAVGVSFAIQATIQAVGYTVGMGAGSLISRSLGRKDLKIADHFAAYAIIFSVLLGSLITAVGLLCISPLIHFLGATEAVYPHAAAYAYHLLWAAPAMSLGLTLSQLLRAEGKVFASMIGLSVGSGLNIILDPILIFKMNMGVAGASAATLISQATGCAVLLLPYIFGKTKVRPRLNFSVFSKSFCIFPAGFPSLARQGLIAFSTLMLNRSLSLWGDAALAAISIVSRIFLLAFSICLGVGQGMMPIAGYHSGSGEDQYVFAIYQKAIRLGFWLLVLTAFPLCLYAPFWISCFTDDPQVIKIGADALRLYIGVLPFHSLITCSILLLQAIGRQVPATTLAACRQGLVFVCFFAALPKFFGLSSLIWVQPLSDVVTFLLSILAYRYSKHFLTASKQTVD